MAAEPRVESGFSVSDWYVFRPPFSNISSIMSVLLRLEWSQVLVCVLFVCLMIGMSQRPRSVVAGLEAFLQDLLLYYEAFLP